MKLENQLKAGEKLPFSELIYCNIGKSGRQDFVSHVTA